MANLYSSNESGDLQGRGNVSPRPGEAAQEGTPLPSLHATPGEGGGRAISLHDIWSTVSPPTSPKAKLSVQRINAAAFLRAEKQAALMQEETQDVKDAVDAVIAETKLDIDIV